MSDPQASITLIPYDDITFLMFDDGETLTPIGFDAGMMKELRALLLPTEQELWDMVRESWTDKAEWTADRFLARLRARLYGEKST